MHTSDLQRPFPDASPATVQERAWQHPGRPSLPFRGFHRGESVVTSHRRAAPKARTYHRGKQTSRYPVTHGHDIVRHEPRPVQPACAAPAGSPRRMSRPRPPLPRQSWRRIVPGYVNDCRAISRGPRRTATHRSRMSSMMYPFMRFSSEKNKFQRGQRCDIGCIIFSWLCL